MKKLFCSNLSSFVIFVFLESHGLEFDALQNNACKKFCKDSMYVVKKLHTILDLCMYIYIYIYWFTHATLFLSSVIP